MAMADLYRSLAIVVVCLLGLIRYAAGQEQPDTIPALSLQVAEVTRVAGDPFAEGPIHPIKCDSRGDLFVQTAPPLARPASSVIKISREGERTSVYSLEKVSGFPSKGVEIIDFNVASTGDVYFLVRKCQDKKCEVAIINFAGDGSVRGVTKLDADFDPARFALFESGEFLVTGLAATKKPDATGGTKGNAVGFSRAPFVSIFDSQGRLVTAVAAPEPESGKRVRKGKNARGGGIPEDEQAAFQASVQLGFLSSGAPGTTYMARRTSTARVYQISFAGRVLRSFEVTPPSDKAWPMDMRFDAGEGRLVFEFNEQVGEGTWDLAHAVVSLVDSRDGRRLIDYHANPEVGIFACYTRDEFTFIGTDKEGHSLMRRVTAR